MIALVRRLFLKLRLLVVPGATRLARAGVGGAGARRGRRGNCRRHGIRLWVVIRLVWSSVQLVGATTNETTGSSLAGRRRAELRGVRAARVGPPSGTVRSFTASRHFLEMCEFHPTEAAGGRGARAAPEVRARRRLFVRCWWWAAAAANRPWRGPCAAAQEWRRSG